MSKLRTVELYRDDERKIIAIEVIELSRTKFNRGGQVNGSIIPLVIIVCASTGHEVLVVNEDSAELDKLKELHAGLDELITKTCRNEANAQFDGD